jgi:hypothetical protein
MTASKKSTQTIDVNIGWIVVTKVENSSDLEEIVASVRLLNGVLRVDWPTNTLSWMITKIPPALPFLE